jgi:hypothetical protein
MAIHLFSPKHPDDVLDYQFDWAGQSNNTGLTDWLESSEVIVTHEITVPDGITLESSSVINEGTSVIFWVSGGTSGENYTVTCNITTATRTVSRSAIIPVKNI